MNLESARIEEIVKQVIANMGNAPAPAAKASAYGSTGFIIVTKAAPNKAEKGSTIPDACP